MNKEDCDNVKKYMKLHFVRNNFIKDSKIEKEVNKLEQSSLFNRVVTLKERLMEANCENEKMTNQLKHYKNKFNDQIEFNSNLSISNKFLLVEDLQNPDVLNDLISQIDILKEQDLKNQIKDRIKQYNSFETIL
mmetsp:Transcript_60135/g.130427  ORF Transcript_60135/g.130427 Transcript_60135/m.130427 type:complete len:134 (-) Transcript_60135:260-661(-)|eukprot:CAMPEP_0116897236 /NCGR_PEP_ID=MMETSP0467-20121206/6283_1 /TAXON_ID=283647 /ORGANISM="Mesodinium pulex, Strain SPMC105" /LENGTH=133 /DNA_ID=CAMNT_0004568811 /DNA_START=1610 /DNA_END=2011 /DNA_ORIENTATION=-